MISTPLVLSESQFSQAVSRTDEAIRQTLLFLGFLPFRLRRCPTEGRSAWEFSLLPA
jgi:hypothetical protein